ncbi:MAG: glycosyltransferase, partial [Thermoanaerobaculia bacterium]|nr:glycosyltransferase [Thermoanaerobaculia bacterium]
SRAGLGLLHRFVPHLHAAGAARSFVAWAEGVLRDRDASLVHAAYGPVGWRALELKRALGTPLVVTFLGDDAAPSLDPWWWWWIRDDGREPDWPARMRELFADGDLFLVEGPCLRQRLIDFGCPPRKVAIQRIAISLPQIDAVRPPARDSAVKVILFAGRLCEQKGVLDALAAARALRRTRRDFELRIVGDDTMTDGSYAARVFAYLRSHGMQGYVRTLGFLDHRDYLRELRGADVFLHPSVTDVEGRTEGGAPTTILEAQAARVPVVATTHADIPYVTLPGESALLAPEGDVEGLARHLGSLLDSADTRRSMGAAGRRHVQWNHDIEREAARLEERYLRLLAGRSTLP